MSAHHLALNDEKTHLIVLANKTNSHQKGNVYIQAGEHVIKPSSTEKLLGCHISETLKWNEHLMENKESLLNQLNGRMKGLTSICRRASFKTRLMVANSVYMSKLCYLMQIWGGASSHGSQYP